MFRPGDRVRSTSPQSLGRVGTVREVVVHPARCDDDGAVLVPARAVVSVDMDGQAAGTAFVSDDGAPLELVRLEEPPTVTVRPLAAASSASTTFTLTAPDVVEVRDGYGGAVAYSLRALAAPLVGWWMRELEHGVNADVPQRLAADLRALAAVVDEDGEPGEGAPAPDPVPVYRGGVVVGHRWPDGSPVEWDEAGEPIR